MLRRARYRITTVLVALVSLLFMQLAVAGYVCPAESSANTAGVAAMAMPDMPCAEFMQGGMDEQQPGLCHAHCHAGQQSADKYELPSPVNISALPVDFISAATVPAFSRLPLQAPHLQQATAPPLAIRYCCFRL